VATCNVIVNFSDFTNGRTIKAKKFAFRISLRLFQLFYFCLDIQKM